MPPILGQFDKLSESQMWVLILLVALAVTYALLIRPMLKRKKDPLEKPAAFSSISKHRGVERQMENLLVELSDMARQITGQLDTRAARLEVLMREADEKIEALRKANGNGSALPLGPSTSFESPPAEPARETIDPRHAEIYSLADEGRDARDIAAQLGRPSGEIELILALRSRG